MFFPPLVTNIVSQLFAGHIFCRNHPKSTPWSSMRSSLLIPRYESARYWIVRAESSWASVDHANEGRPSVVQVQSVLFEPAQFIIADLDWKGCVPRGPRSVNGGRGSGLTSGITEARQRNGTSASGTSSSAGEEWQPYTRLHTSLFNV